MKGLGTLFHQRRTTPLDLVSLDDVYFATWNTTQITTENATVPQIAMKGFTATLLSPLHFLCSRTPGKE
jgi:hypothetical protein